MASKNIPILELIEGAFILHDWVVPDGHLTQPKIEGRFIMQSGIMALISYGQSKPENDTHFSQYGRYSIEGEKFTYFWEYRSRISKHPNETEMEFTANGEVHEFTVVKKSNVVILESKQKDKATFNFYPDRLEYFEGGSLVRTWNRVVA